MLSSASSGPGMSAKQHEYDRVFRSKRKERLFQKRCRIVETGSTGHAVLLEFEDGEIVVTSKRAIKRLR